MRLDALHASRNHGAHANKAGDNAETQKLYRGPLLPQEAALFALFTGHFWREGTDYSNDKHRCAVHWIADGLALDTRTFLEIPGRFCSFGFIASAEGLELDLSGLGLRDTPEFQRRLNQVVLTAAPLVAQSQTDFVDFVKQARSQQKAGMAFMGAAGLGLLWFAPPLGAALLGVGAYKHYKQPLCSEEEMTSLVSGDLHWLKADFEKLVPQAKRNLRS